MSDSPKVKLETDEQKVSYGFGLQFGAQLLKNNFEGLDIHAVFTAMHDMINGQASSLSEPELNAAYKAVETNEKTKQKTRAEQALGQGKEYLEQNINNPEVQATESGVQYQVLHDANGEKPGPKSTVRTHYHGTFIDGKIFDSSIERNQPAEFGVNEVIPGWTEILQMMPVGAKWRITVPSELAYGPAGSPPVIPPNCTLLFDIELLGILSDTE